MAKKTTAVLFIMNMKDVSTFFNDIEVNIFFSHFLWLYRVSGLEFFETSAKENINVKAVFERLVDIICDKMSESLDTDPTLVSSQAKGTRLTENPNPQASNCQC